MLLFLRTISLIIILLSSVAIAISAEREANPKNARIDVIVKRSDVNRPDSPWMAVQDLDWNAPDETNPIHRIQFTIRSDLPAEIQEKLRGGALELDWNTFKREGIFIEQLNEQNRVKAQYFIGFQAKVPTWLSRRIRTGVFRSTPVIGVNGGLKPGDVIAVIDRDLETYPREINPQWSIMDLLRQHTMQKQIGEGPEAYIHRGSSICSAYLEDLYRNRKAP